MAHAFSVADALDEERRRLAVRPKKEKTAEQRETRRARSKWHNNIWWCWYEAHLLSDGELRWLAAVSAAAKGNRSAEDARKLAELVDELHERNLCQRQRQRKEVVDALIRMGLKAPPYYYIDSEAP